MRSEEVNIFQSDPSNMGDTKQPMIATVIPVLNESEYITACLDSLIEQNYPATHHMIFILDGGSSDNTTELVEAAILRSAQTNGPKIELHSNPGKFVSQGRNKALELMPSTITHVLELIGHSTVNPDHLQVLVEEWSRISAIEDQELGALGSRVLPRKGELDRVESWVEGALGSPFGSGGGQFDRFTTAAPCKIPAFVLHSRRALVDVGGWDESFISSQDSDLSMRLASNGYALWRTPKTVVHMTKRTGLLRWSKMGHRYGFWRTKTVIKHPKRISLREYLPWLGLLATLSLAFAHMDWWLLPPMAYVCVLAIEAVRMSVKFGRISMLLGVPLCLFMLHVSFSVGLLDGFLRRGRAPSDRG